MSARPNKRPSTVTITVELTPEQAAGLARFAEKTGWEEAMAVLYPHVDRDVRCDQTHSILEALSRVDKALADAGVATWPWIDGGRP